jgi:hypothetical protein
LFLLTLLADNELCYDAPRAIIQFGRQRRYNDPPHAEDVVISGRKGEFLIHVYYFMSKTEARAITLFRVLRP